MLRKNESLNIYSIALFFVIFFGSSIFFTNRYINK